MLACVRSIMATLWNPPSLPLKGQRHYRPLLIPEMKWRPNLLMDQEKYTRRPSGWTLVKGIKICRVIQKPILMYLSCRSSDAYKPGNPWPRGSATLNVNEWLKYFNVRSNPIDMVAGASYTVKMTPIQHTASPGIRDLDRQRRKCQFKDEQEWKCLLCNMPTVPQPWLNYFRNQTACSIVIHKKDADLSAG